MGLVTNLELRGSKRIAHHPADQQTRGQLRGDMMMRWRMESEETQDVSDEYETFPVDRNTPSRVKWMVGRWSRTQTGQPLRIGLRIMITISSP